LLRLLSHDGDDADVGVGACLRRERRAQRGARVAPRLGAPVVVRAPERAAGVAFRVGQQRKRDLGEAVGVGGGGRPLDVHEAARKGDREERALLGVALGHAGSGEARALGGGGAAERGGGGRGRVGGRVGCGARRGGEEQK
jgi:hypothetical protein